MRAVLTSAALAAALVLSAPVLTACSSTDVTYDTPEQRPGSGRHDPFGRTSQTASREQSIFGEGGIFDGGTGGGTGEGGIGVNGFLWRASLDTLSFMPLASADPFGGVIITDWYATPGAPDERTKVTVYILDKRLRADGLRVAVFRQQRAADTWMDAAVNPDTAIRLENAILVRARELRVASLGN